MVGAFRNHDVLLQIQINLTFSASFPRPRLHLDFQYVVPIDLPSSLCCVEILPQCWTCWSSFIHSIQSDSITHHRCPTGSFRWRVRVNCQPLIRYTCLNGRRYGQVRAGQQINLLFHYSKATICLAPEVDFSCLIRLTIIITSSLAAIPHFPHL